MTALTLSDLRRHAISRSLFKPTTLPKAIAKLGCLKADQIRPRTRARLDPPPPRQQLPRGELELRYSKLPIEEGFFINYGFVPRDRHALMHPRAARKGGVIHLREVDARLQCRRGSLEELRPSSANGAVGGRSGWKVPSSQH